MRNEDTLAFLTELNADIIGLQETKIDSSLTHLLSIPSYHSYWCCSTDKKGYAGVVLLSRVKPISVTNGLAHPVHDAEGRVITAEYDNYYIVCVYVPNAGAALDRLPYRINEWDKEFRKYVYQLIKGTNTKPGKGVIIMGDMNVARSEIDLHSPKTNLKSAGFTKEERESFALLLQGENKSTDTTTTTITTSTPTTTITSTTNTTSTTPHLIDVHRHLHPTDPGYTFWGHRFNARANNKGWRLDYFLCSNNLVDNIVDMYVGSEVTPQGKRRSDHAPIMLHIDPSENTKK